MKRVDPEMTRRAREMRNQPTQAERLLWRALSTLRPKFTRQLVIGPFIADFACRGAKLVVELDGRSHDASGNYDAGRTAYLEQLGWRVLRFGNQEAVENPEGVAYVCGEAAEARHPPPTPP